jgi:hypothetical protein
MYRAIWSFVVFSLFSAGCLGEARAQDAKPATLTGCSYEGFEGCHYLLTNSGQTYQLVPNLIPMPPPNRIVTVTGVIKPKHLGFCTAREILLASVVILTENTCRAGPRRKEAH